MSLLCNPSFSLKINPQTWARVPVILTGSRRKPVDALGVIPWGSSLVTQNAVASVTETAASKYRLGFQTARDQPCFLPWPQPRTGWIVSCLCCRKVVIKHIAGMDVYNGDSCLAWEGRCTRMVPGIRKRIRSLRSPETSWDNMLKLPELRFKLKKPRNCLAEVLVHAKVASGVHDNCSGFGLADPFWSSACREPASKYVQAMSSRLLLHPVRSNARG